MFWVFFWWFFYFTHLKIRPNEMSETPPNIVREVFVSQNSGIYQRRFPLSWTTNRRPGSTNVLSIMLTLYSLLHFIVSWSQGGLQRGSTIGNLNNTSNLTIVLKGKPSYTKTCTYCENGLLHNHQFNPPSLQCFRNPVAPVFGLSPSVQFYT